MANVLIRYALAGAFALSLSLPLVARAQVMDDLTGTYVVRGTNPGDGGSYGGTITVKLVGEVYQIQWTGSGQNAVGTGLRLGDTLAVTWQDPANKDTAVAVYIVMPDGGLKGRWAPLGGAKAGSEDWTRKAQ